MDEGGQNVYTFSYKTEYNMMYNAQCIIWVI